MTDTTVGQFVIVLTTIGGFIVTAWRENRTRQWANEDRLQVAELAAMERRDATAEIVARATAEAQATRIHNETVAETLRIEGLATASKLREEARIAAETLRIDTAVAVEVTRLNTLRESSAIQAKQERHQTLMVAKIEEAKDAAHEAYKEANHVNIKIEDLNARLLQQGTDALASSTASAQQIDHIEDMAVQIAAGAPPYIDRLEHIKESVEGLREQDVTRVQVEGSDTNTRVRDIQLHVDHGREAPTR